MRRNLLLTIACLFLSTLIWAKDKKGGFTVEFKLKNVTDCTILVSQVSPDATSFYCDTLELRKGKATYNGSVPYPQLYHFSFTSRVEDYMGGIDLFVDNTEKIVVKGNSLRNLNVKGQSICNEYMEVEKALAPYFKEYYRLQGALSEAKKNKNKEEADVLNAKCKKAHEQIYNQLLSLPNYSTSKVAPYYVYAHFMGDTKQLEKALMKFAPELDSNGYVIKSKTELAQQKQTAIGQDAYDFCLQDLSGKEYRLKDYRGKYLLLEFSASWCGWCKKEIPYLKRVYENYSANEKFAMLTINLDDKRSKWENDVKELQLPWPVISDLKAFKSEVTKAYNVHGIPCIYLINPEGKIIEKHLRGEKMIKTLERYVGPCKAFDFSIDGTVDGFKDGTVTIYDGDQVYGKEKVTDGHYHIQGRLSGRRRLDFGIAQEGKDYCDVIYAVYMQKSNMKAHSYIGKRFYQTDMEGASIQDKIDQINVELKKTPDFIAFDEVNQKVQQAYREHSTAPKSLRKEQNKYLYAAFSSIFQTGDKEYEEAFAVTLDKYSALLNEDQIYFFYNQMGNEAKECSTMKGLIASIEQENRTGKGKSAPDFQARDLKGNQYTLKDFRGKYVYLEFSASWCGWCKKEIPYIKKAFEKFGNKDIIFITMMMDDKLEVWKKDSAKYNLPWLSLSDLKGIKKSEIAKAYNISGVPMSFLINPDGCIVEKDVRGEDIIPTLEKYIH